jgi:hypothetical protein
MTDDDDDDDDDDEVIIAARDSRSPVCLNNCVRRQPVPGVSETSSAGAQQTHRIFYDFQRMG